MAERAGGQELRPHVAFKRWLIGHGQVLVFLGVVWFVLIVVGFGVAAVLVAVEYWSCADVLLLGVAMGRSARPRVCQSCC